MQLHLKYKDGSTRLINLTNSFFKSDSTGKMSDPGISKKALDIAYHCGTEPYYVAVFRGNATVYETYIHKNKPEERREEPFMVVDETKIKKKLRNEFKNKKFTDKYTFQF